MTEKVVRDGKVAVLVSRGFGAGWSSWNDVPGCETNPEIVALVEREASAEEIAAKADELWPGHYWDGAGGLCIEWVPEGMRYKIDEYHGAESIELESDVGGWSVA